MSFACTWFGWLSIEYVIMFAILKGRNQCFLVGSLFWKKDNVIPYLTIGESWYINCISTMLANDEFLKFYKHVIQFILLVFNSNDTM